MSPYNAGWMAAKHGYESCPYSSESDRSAWSRGYCHYIDHLKRKWALARRR